MMHLSFAETLGMTVADAFLSCIPADRHTKLVCYEGGFVLYPDLGLDGEYYITAVYQGDHGTLSVSYMDDATVDMLLDWHDTRDTIERAMACIGVRLGNALSNCQITTLTEELGLV